MTDAKDAKNAEEPAWAGQAWEATVCFGPHSLLQQLFIYALLSEPEADGRIRLLNLETGSQDAVNVKHLESGKEGVAISWRRVA